MANCSGTTPISPTTGCFSNCSSTITQTNCGCTPCTAPVIVQGDLDNQVLVPVLADVIQNCICVSRCETGFPTNLLIETNLPLPTETTTGIVAPSGTICITNVSYSYSCIGVPGEAGPGVPGPTLPTIDAFVGCSATTLTPVTPSCVCTDAAAAAATNTTGLYNDFTGIARTASCCCNQVAQAYAQTKIVERDVEFSICNLNITVTGTIGGQEFTGVVRGPYTAPAADGDPGTLAPFANPTPILDLDFPEDLNFCGIMCLPTSTRLTISESFDNCLVVDCMRPVTASYSVATDPGQTLAVEGEAGDVDNLANASFLTSADLSLIVSKNIFATTSERLAVITSAGAQVVCSDNNSVPACPQGTPCASATPCPGPRPTIPTA